MDNVLSHAASDTGGYVQATAYDKRVEFVVADSGIGIPASLSMKNDAEALEHAISEGKTRDRNSNMGNGLFGSFQAAKLSGGQFEIISKYGSLYFDQKSKQVASQRERIPYHGTSVRCGIGLQSENLLERGLQFGGRPHIPLYDYIERTFETESGEIVVSVKEHNTADLGTRGGGIRFRRQLENLLREQPTVTLDFDDVRVISSSFADEVFGRLFVNIGPTEFMRRIEILNADPTVQGLIDRAIVQRTRIGNSPDA